MSDADPMNDDPARMNPLDRADAHKIIIAAGEILEVLYTTFEEADNIMVCLALVHQKLIEVLPPHPEMPTVDHILNFHRTMVVEGMEFREAKRKQKEANQ
jgi:hypothetical protein